MSSEEQRQGILRMQMAMRKMTESLKMRMGRLAEEHAKATVEERSQISAWQSKTVLHGSLASMLSFGVLRLPPWPLSTFWSVLAGGLSGVVVGSLSAVRQAPGVLESIIEQPASSRLVDEAVCPALQELETCLQDRNCADTLNKTSAAFGRNTIDVVSLLVRCRERARKQAGEPENAGQDDNGHEWYTPPPAAFDNFSYDKPPSDGDAYDA